MNAQIHIKETRFTPEGPQKAAAAFKFVPVENLKYLPPQYIIDELFETETLGVIFGEPGCGKSFLAVDIALSVASGTPFHNYKVKQGSVFFIAGEGHNGLARRFAAWSKARDVPLSGVPLFKSERAAQFLDGKSAKAVGDAVAAMAKQYGSPALIIIDTLARNFGAGDENNTRDMSEFIAAIDDLKARFIDCSVLIIHHTGHAEKQRARGATALKGALDTEYRVEMSGTQMTLKNTKMKDAEPPKDLFLRFKKVDLDGIVKSAALEAVDTPERQYQLSLPQRLAQSTYLTAAVQNGIWDDGVFCGVHVEYWRSEFYDKHASKKLDAKKKAFQRVRNKMTKNQRLTEQKNVYLINDSAIQVQITLQRDKWDMAGQDEKCPDEEAESSGTNGTTP